MDGYNCARCNFSTKYKANLTRHMVIHTMEDAEMRKSLLTCVWCKQIFSSKYNRDRHMFSRCQLDPMKFVEPVCNVNQDASNVAQHASNVNPFTQNVACESPNVANQRSDKKFPCPTCFRTYTRNSILQQHIPLCDKTKSILECPKCHEVFSSRQSKSKHIKRCDAESSPSQPQVINSTSQVINATHSFNNTTNIQNQVNNTQIVINGLGHEYTGHLTNDFLEKQALCSHGAGVAKCIESVHFNPQYPQNQNLRAIANNGISNKFIAVYDNDKWNLRDFKNTMIKLIQDFRSKLIKRMDEPDFKAKYPNVWMNLCAKLSKLTVENNPNDFYSILDQVRVFMHHFDKITL